MFTVIISLILILHGLVHVWYVLLISKVVNYLPEMGWTGESWIFPGSPDQFLIRYSAIILYSLTSILFMVSGVGLLSAKSWAVNILVVSVIISSLLIMMFFDGHFEMLVQKGILGLIINVLILSGLFFMSDKF